MPTKYLRNNRFSLGTKKKDVEYVRLYLYTFQHFDTNEDDTDPIPSNKSRECRTRERADSNWVNC